MGQTLTHGVYLPDEGERNCYNGLAANWSILDGAVGTVAEHSTQIAGKAPAVHTHTKADITDFPALANIATSGSYNDLSNIPASFTPSSHTHGNISNDGKVGTTANLPLITGTGGVVQAGSFGTSANTFCEGNDSRLSDARTPVAHTHTKSDVTDLLNSNFIPSANNSYDLGSSSYQWNNLYAKGYYYNGVAWGLDKSNNWSGNNTFSGITSFTAANININSSNFSLGDTVSSNQVKRFQWYDASNNRYACIAVNYATDKSVWIDIPLRTKNTEGTSFIDKTIRFQVKPDNTSAFLPVTNSAIDLGTPTSKWKSLNGINPGALSLPDLSNVVSVDTTNWSLTGARNSYTPSANGWFFIRVEGTGVCKLNIHLGSTDNNYPTWSNWNTDTYTVLTVPAIQGVKLYVYVTADLIRYCRFYPCLGNV